MKALQKKSKGEYTMNENRIEEVKAILKAATEEELHSIFLLVCSYIQPGRGHKDA